MKKLVLVLLIMLFLTGCGPLTRKKVFEHLEHEYQNEEFEIISLEKDVPVPYTCGKYGKEGSDPYLGRVYTVKSKETGIVFEVEDGSAELSGLGCRKVIVDNYKIEIIKRAIKDFGDSRLDVDSIDNIVVHYEDFSSSYELASVLLEFYKKYEKDVFERIDHSFSGSVYIYIYFEEHSIVELLEKFETAEELAQDIDEEIKERKEWNEKLKEQK